MPDLPSTLRALVTFGHCWSISALAADRLADAAEAGPDDPAAMAYSARLGFPTDPASHQRAFATLDEAVAWLSEAAVEDVPDGPFAAWLGDFDDD